MTRWSDPRSRAVALVRTTVPVMRGPAVVLVVALQAWELEPFVLIASELGLKGIPELAHVEPDVLGVAVDVLFG